MQSKILLPQSEQVSTLTITVESCLLNRARDELFAARLSAAWGPGRPAALSTYVRTVRVQSIAGPLKNAYCVRKSSTITFLCNHAICNVRSFSTDLQLTVPASTSMKSNIEYSHARPRAPAGCPCWRYVEQCVRYLA